MNKKTVHILLVLILLTAILAGCGEAPAEAPAPTAAPVAAPTPAPTPDAAAVEAARIEAETRARYEEALALLEAEDYEAAYPLFLELGDYKDAAAHAARFGILQEGTITQRKNNRAPAQETIFRCYYLPDGRPLWREIYGAEDSETCLKRIDWEYDSDGTPRRAITSSFSEGICTTVEYDPLGNVTARSVENTETGEIRVDEFENVFYESGTLQKQTIRYSNNKDNTYTNYYDVNGHLIAEEDDTEFGFYRYEFVFNEHGDQVMQLMYKCEDDRFLKEDDGFLAVFYYHREYDEKGNPSRIEMWTEYSNHPDNKYRTLDHSRELTFGEVYGTSVRTDYMQVSLGIVTDEEHFTVCPVYGYEPAAQQPAAVTEAEAEAEEAQPTTKAEAEKQTEYKEAMEALEAGDYERAYPLFLALGDYKDSAERAASFFILREGGRCKPRPGTIERALFTMDGQPLWEEVYSERDPETLLRRTDGELDSEGRLCRQVTQSFVDGTVTTTEYDPAGNITAQSVESTETGEIRETPYENVFYESGVLKQQTIVQPHRSGRDETTVYHYDASGKRLLADFDLVSGVFREEYAYNEQGDRILRKRILEDGLDKTQVNDPNKDIYLWSYDEEGNVQTQKWYNGVGKLCRAHTYESILGAPILTELVCYDTGILGGEMSSYTARLVYEPEL